MKNTLSVALVLSITGCASGPTYQVPPKQINYSELSSYWMAEKAVSEKNTKLISSPKMGCNAVYLPESGKTSDLYINVKFTIDSTGKQYDQEITGASEKVDLEMANWALKFGLSPTYSFKPSAVNTLMQPIISDKKLYLIPDSPLCASANTDIAFYSNQSMNISNKNITK